MCIRDSRFTERRCKFRRRLAGKAQEAKVAAAERASSGQVQAQVQDNSAAAAAADNGKKTEDKKTADTAGTQASGSSSARP